MITGIGVLALNLLKRQLWARCVGAGKECRQASMACGQLRVTQGV